MKKGQKNKYKKAYFNPLNNQPTLDVIMGKGEKTRNDIAKAKRLSQKKGGRK